MYGAFDLKEHYQQQLREASRRVDEINQAKEHLKRKSHLNVGTADLVSADGWGSGGLLADQFRVLGKTATAVPVVREQEELLADVAARLTKSVAEHSTQRAAEGNWHERLEAQHLAAFGEDKEAAWRKIMSVAGLAYSSALRDSTTSSYNSGTASYEFFANKMGFDGYPTSQMKLIGFTSWSATRGEGLTVGSISQYLSAIRSKQISLGLAWQDRDDMPLLQRVLRGFTWMQRAEKGGRVRLALTYDILKDVLAKKWARYYEAVKEGKAPSIYSMDHPRTAGAAYSTGIGGLLRPGEFTVRVTGTKGTSKPLMMDYFNPLAELDGEVARLIGGSLFIPSRKTAPDGEVVDLGMTGDPLVCSVTNVVVMKDEREKLGEKFGKESFLFAIKDDGKTEMRPLTYEDLTRALQADLKAAGYDASSFKGHSFRIGGATSLAQNGVPTAIIEDMGGWTRGSLALPLYIRQMSSAAVRRKFAGCLVRPYVPGPQDPVEGYVNLWQAPLPALNVQ